MRIATWNLEGRSNPLQGELLLKLDCDVLLLTEVSPRFELAGYAMHRAAADMYGGKSWAAVASRLLMSPLPDPHFATASATFDGLTLWSSILPWRGCGHQPWGEGTHAERTNRALDELTSNAPQGQLIWGGDWNHALNGPEHAGTTAGREHVCRTVALLDLQVPTALLPHAIKGIQSIDHIAVPRSATINCAERVSALVDGRRLSDHDAYVVDVQLDAKSPPPS